MIWEWQGARHETTAVIYKVDGEYGDLSNLSNGFPLTVAGVNLKSSEALYQACKYPHKPEWQQEILDARHAMEAKMKARKDGRPKEARPDWEEVKVPIMRWVLRVKLAQHPRRMAALVRWSGTGPIIEQSRKDRFWGAVEEPDGVFRGDNMLGQLWTEFREEVRTKFADGQEASLLKVDPPAVPDFKLLGHEIGVVQGTGDFGSKPSRR
jgi:type I restriction enzyme S subunit